MPLEALIAIMAMAGAFLVTGRKPKLQLIGLHIWLIGAVIGMIFFMMIHLYYMGVLSMGGLVLCAHGISTRLPYKPNH
jgi:hypothetical protein